MLVTRVRRRLLQRHKTVIPGLLADTAAETLAPMELGQMAPQVVVLLVVVFAQVAPAKAAVERGRRATVGCVAARSAATLLLGAAHAVLDPTPLSPVALLMLARIAATVFSTLTAVFFNHLLLFVTVLFAYICGLFLILTLVSTFLLSPGSPVAAMATTSAAAAAVTFIFLAAFLPAFLPFPPLLLCLPAPLSTPAPASVVVQAGVVDLTA